MALSVVATVVVLGCGGDNSGLDRRYPVSGTVKYKGQPVAKGTIAFEPTDPVKSRHASGFIENGSYTLTTSGEGGDGALPGDYRIAISASGVDMTGLAKKTGGLVHQGDADFKKVVEGAKALVPAKYARSESSGLTKKVEATTNRIDFDLTD